MKKVDDGKRKKEKRENNFVFSGHSRHCQSAPRTPTDWNAARSCQLLAPENKGKMSKTLRVGSQLDNWVKIRIVLYHGSSPYE